MSTILDDTDVANDSGVATLDPPDAEQALADDGPATAARPKGKANDPAAEREMVRAWSNGLDWPTIGWLGLVHLGALAAPFCFTWAGLIAFCVLSWITGSLGVCLGYHRLLTHGSFQTYRGIRRAFGLLGTLAGEGPPITWVAVHRKHHRFSDQEGDPHSPHDGGWWSHVLWLFPRPKCPQWQNMMQTYARDLLKDPFFRILDTTFLLWHVGLGAAMLALGWCCWDLRTGVSLFVWGMFLRLVYVLHITWAVNSASHMWGYRNYETRTTAAICGGSASWPSAKAGTTTITPSPPVPARASMVGVRLHLPGDSRDGARRAGLEGGAGKEARLRGASPAVFVPIIQGRTIRPPHGRPPCRAGDCLPVHCRY